MCVKSITFGPSYQADVSTHPGSKGNFRFMEKVYRSDYLLITVTQYTGNRSHAWWTEYGFWFFFLGDTHCNTNKYNKHYFYYILLTLPVAEATHIYTLVTLSLVWLAANKDWLAINLVKLQGGGTDRQTDGTLGNILSRAREVGSPLKAAVRTQTRTPQDPLARYT